MLFGMAIPPLRITPPSISVPPPLPGRNPNGTMRGLAERMPTLPERTMDHASDRRVGLDEHGLEPEALVGPWYDVMSTWLSRVRFSFVPLGPGGSFRGPPTAPAADPKQRMGYLSVEFLDGATIQYTDPLPFGVFDDMINSSSKGQYIWHSSAGLIHKPYTELSPAIRKVTAEMRRLRAPKSGGRGQRLIGGTRPPPLPRR